MDKGKYKYFNSEYQRINLLGVSVKCPPPGLAYLALDNICDIYCILLIRPLISINGSIFLDNARKQEEFRGEWVKRFGQPHRGSGDEPSPTPANAGEISEVCKIFP